MAPDPVANEPVAVAPRSRGRRSIRLGLRGRLVGYFLLLSGVTVLVVSVVAYVRATDDLTSAIYERLDAVAENKTASLSRWLDEQTRNVVFVGRLPGFGDDTRVFLDPAALGGRPLGARRPACARCSRPWSRRPRTRRSS